MFPNIITADLVITLFGTGTLLITGTTLAFKKNNETYSTLLLFTQMYKLIM